MLAEPTHRERAAAAGRAGVSLALLERRHPAIMFDPTPGQKAAAERLGISLDFVQTPITVATLVEMVADLQRRVEELEQQKRSWLRK